MHLSSGVAAIFLRFTWLTMTVMLVATFAGCGARNHPAPVLSADQQVRRPIRVAVLPLNDGRPDTTKEAKLHQIPLVFWDTFTRSKFDVAFGSRTRPWPAMMMQKLADDLQKRQAFELVEFFRNPAGAESFPVVIRGTVTKTEQRGRRYSYGVSILMRYLWVLGFPNQSVWYDIEANIEVIETATNTRIWVSEPIQLTTRTRVITNYHDEFNLDFVHEAFDRFAIAAALEIQHGLPPAGDPIWARIRTAHTERMNRQRIQQDLTQRTIPPELLISRPRAGDEVRTDRVEVVWNSRSVAGIRSMSLEVNGSAVALPEADRAIAAATTAREAPRSLSEVTDVSLRLGQNTIRMALEDHLGQKAEREVTLTRLPQPLFDGRRFAVVIGVNSHSHPEIPGGLPSEDTARAFAEYLTDPFGGQMSTADVRLLLGPQATRNAVLQALNEATRNALASDTIIIYFSGYSLAMDARGPGFLLTYDTDPGNLNGTAISIDKLRETLGQALAANTILIADAAFPLQPYQLNAHELLGDMARRLRSAVVIGAVMRGDRFTTWTPGSLSFGQMLVQELRGSLADANGDGRVTMRELVDRLIDQSDALGLETPGESGRYDRELGIKMLR